MYFTQKKNIAPRTATLTLLVPHASRAECPHTSPPRTVRPSTSRPRTRPAWRCVGLLSCLAKDKNPAGITGQDEPQSSVKPWTGASTASQHPGPVPLLVPRLHPSTQPWIGASVAPTCSFSCVSYICIFYLDVVKI